MIIMKTGKHLDTIVTSVKNSSVKRKSDFERIHLWVSAEVKLKAQCTHGHG